MKKCKKCGISISFEKVKVRKGRYYHQGCGGEFVEEGEIK